MRAAIPAWVIGLLLSACAQAQAPTPAAAPVRAAILDAEPDVTAQVQAILDRVAAGTFETGTLTENARTALPAAGLQAMATALRPCGQAPALALLERSTKGEDRLYLYRAPCGGKPLLVEIGFAKGARINRLQVRPQ